MASVKLYLDKRSKKKDGTYPIKLTVTHGKAFHIPLDVSIPQENWIGGKIEGGIKNKNFLNSYLLARLTSVENLLLTLNLQGSLERMSHIELKRRIEGLNTPEGYQEEKTESILGESYLFREHAEKFITTREAAGTRLTYRYTMDMLVKHYCLGSLTFSDINYDWIESLEAKLRKTCRTNTISIHLRNIRAIYRNATKKKLVSRDLYPFEDYTIKSEVTRHRNLSIKDLRTIRDYPVESHQMPYRDLFMLLFYMLGINIVDILHATPASIHNGRFEYRRAKTGRLYSVKLEPEALEIIRKYPGKKYLLSFIDNYSNYKDFLHRFNLNLKQIGPVEWVQAKSKNGRGTVKKSRKPLFPFISSYYARHSWASIAAELDIPKDTIAAALGHGSKSITDIYINFDTRKVDKANRRVLDYLNQDD